MYNILMLRYVADQQRITAEYWSYALSHYTKEFPSAFLHAMNPPSQKPKAWCWLNHEPELK